MTAPCPCWLDNYSHSTDLHCCFRDVPLEDCHLGELPPCGHWHPDVERPVSDLFGNAVVGGLSVTTQEPQR